MNIRKNVGKHAKINEYKIEDIESIKKRILNLAEEGDYGLFSPPMDAQTALDELIRYILGEGWWSLNFSTEQINTDALYAIELRLRRWRHHERKRRRI